MVDASPTPDVADAGDAAEELPSSAMDPAEVYFVGTLKDDEDFNRYRTVCDPRSGEPILGFAPDEIGLVFYLSPVDRQLYYLNRDKGSLRRLVSDPIMVNQGGPLAPVAPKRNDIAVATPRCATDGSGNLSAMIFHPTDGTYYYRCMVSSNPTFHSTGERVKTCGDDSLPKALGTNGEVLCEKSVVSDDVVHPIPDADQLINGWLTFRSRPDGGFWTVVLNGMRYERWTIHVDGTLSLDGTYAAPPENWRIPDGPPTITGIALSGSGALYRSGVSAEGQPGFADDVYDILRFSEDFQSVEEIYNEANNPRCRFVRWYFVTGT